MFNLFWSGTNFWFSQVAASVVVVESIITVGVVEEEKDNKMVLHLSVSICKDLLAEIKRAGRNCVAGRGE